MGLEGDGAGEVLPFIENIDQLAGMVAAFYHKLIEGGIPPMIAAQMGHQFQAQLTEKMFKEM